MSAFRCMVVALALCAGCATPRKDVDHVVAAAGADGRTGAEAVPAPGSATSTWWAARGGAFVLVDCSSGAVRDLGPDASSQRFAPCSTFKVWNTLIGLESGVISSAAEAFYTWDGTNRSVADWNHNLTLGEAFRVSCVPAFQELARRIGSARMQAGIDKLGYGNRDTSAGVDVFWLPSPGRRTILISPREQAELMRRLAVGQVPFSARSQEVLKEIMRVRTSPRGVLYGKTGSAADGAGMYVMGWFVGYVESGSKKIAFACTVRGASAMGKDARAMVEAVLHEQGLL